MPYISIITPVHDRPHYLEEAVDSIQKQSYVDWEHIIIDDGSSSAYTKEVLQKISALPKTAVYRTENRGPGAARNYGIENAKGDYILTLDDDDKWHPEFIVMALDIFEKKPKAGVVTAWVQEFGTAERILQTKGGDVKNFLVENNSVHGMFKKEYWAACGKYDEHMTAYEDWDLWLRITAMGYLVEVVPHPFFFYRIHRHTSRQREAREKHLELFRYIVEKNRKIYQEHVVDAVCQLEERTIDITKDFESLNWRHKLKRIIGND